jgi:hypothetical protein
MSEVKLMQEMLDSVLVKIEDLEDSIKSCKSDDPKLTELNKSLNVQQRVKITLVQSIQELSPSTNTITLFTAPVSILTKLKNYFWGKSN